jgi:hypothetical protein
MTDEQINAAIAEACGFICLDEFQVDKDGAKFRFWDYPKNWKGANKQPWCLDFCNDLNAMHEAEKVLTKEQVREYQIYMYDMACEIQNTCGRWMPYSATARYRAEAFLRTLGNWEENK